MLVAGVALVVAEGAAAVMVEISDRSLEPILRLDGNLPQIEPAVLRVFD